MYLLQSTSVACRHAIHHTLERLVPPFAIRDTLSLVFLCVLPGHGKEHLNAHLYPALPPVYHQLSQTAMLLCVTEHFIIPRAIHVWPDSYLPYFIRVVTAIGHLVCPPVAQTPLLRLTMVASCLPQVEYLTFHWGTVLAARFLYLWL